MLISEIVDDDVEQVIAWWQACGLTRPWNDPHRDLATARPSGTSTILVGRAGYGSRWCSRTPWRASTGTAAGLAT